MSRARWRLVLVVGAAALAILALGRAGAGGLASPPLRSWAAAEAWFERAGPGAAPMAVLRLVALAGAGWLLLAAVLQLLATLSPGRALQRIADGLSPRVVRRLTQGVAGLTVTVGLVGPAAPATPGPDPPGTAVMEVLDGETTTTVPAAAAPAAPARAVPVLAPTPDDEVRVAPGDSFWSIAADVVADHPRSVAVDAYWRGLVAANRARLVDPSNPDLLFPGQVLTLPAIEA